MRAWLKFKSVHKTQYKIIDEVVVLSTLVIQVYKTIGMALFIKLELINYQIEKLGRDCVIIKYNKIMLHVKEQNKRDKLLMG